MIRPGNWHWVERFRGYWLVDGMRKGLGFSKCLGSWAGSSRYLGLMGLRLLVGLAMYWG